MRESHESPFFDAIATSEFQAKPPNGQRRFVSTDPLRSRLMLMRFLSLTRNPTGRIFGRGRNRRVNVVESGVYQPSQSVTITHEACSYSYSWYSVHCTVLRTPWQRLFHPSTESTLRPNKLKIDSLSLPGFKAKSRFSPHPSDRRPPN